MCLCVCVCVCLLACRHVRVCELQSRVIVADWFRSRCHCESLEERCCDEWSDGAGEERSFGTLLNLAGPV